MYRLPARITSRLLLHSPILAAEKLVTINKYYYLYLTTGRNISCNDVFWQQIKELLPISVALP